MMGDSGGSCSTTDFGTQCSVQPVVTSAGTQAQVTSASASIQTQMAVELESRATSTEVNPSAHKCTQTTQTTTPSTTWYVTAALLGLVLAFSLVQRRQG